MVVLRDILIFVLVFGLPAYIVLRAGWRGVIAGSLTMWCIGYLVGVLERAGEPKSESLGMAVWIVLGWLVSLVYCGAIYGARELFRFIRRKTGKSVP